MRLKWFGRGRQEDETPIPYEEQAHGGATLPVGENCRELGGYPLPSGGTTLKHRFLRSGTTSALSKREVAFLADYGVRRVMDLRSKEEVRGEPDRLAGIDGIAYRNTPLYRSNLHDDKLSLRRDQDDYLTNGYINMLANSEAVRDVFSFMSEAEDDECVLYHCTAGMDRTGVTSMLLLGLVGASRETIVADYGYSFSSREDIDSYLDNGSKTRWDCIPMFCDLIGRVYDTACASYGTIRGYLLACGLTDGQLDRICHHLTGE